jgi:hypothetical protein
VTKLQSDLAATHEDFGSLAPQDIPPWPIAFFGNLREAVIVTVGVNPSAGEFANGRWDAIRTKAQVEDRLFSYFTNPVPPHRWFNTWEFALNKIDASYYGKAKHVAAHVDLSPRPTVKITQPEQENLFFDMVHNDLFCFVRFIKAARKCRLVLLAGAVTSDCYAVEMLQHLPAPNRLHCSFNRYAQRGPAKVSWHRLQIGNRELPLFFCSCSPSDKTNRHLLVDRVKANAKTLRKLGEL